MTEPTALPPELMRQGISPAQLMAIFWAHRRLIVLTTFVVVLAVVLISKYVLPKKYEATATLQFDFQVYDPTTGKDFPAYLAQSYMSTQVDILGSPATLRAAVERLGWAQDPKWTASYDSSTGASLEDYLANEMNKRLTIRSSRDSRLVDVSFEAESPTEAARVANTIAEVYLESQINARREPTQRRAGEYSQQIEALREEVEAAERALSEFRQKHGLIDLDRRADAESTRLEELTRRLVEAEAARHAAEIRATVDAGGIGGERDILDSNYIQGLKSELAALETRRAEMREVLGSRHPDLIALDEQIQELRRRIDGEVRQVAGAVDTAAERARRQEQALRQAVEAQRARVMEARRLSDEASTLVRRLESAEKIYNSALERYDDVLLGSRSQYTNVTIVNRASPPLLHSSPKTRINAILALFAGGFLGLSIASILELRDRRVRCREDIERELGLPVLAELGLRR